MVVRSGISCAVVSTNLWRKTQISLALSPCDRTTRWSILTLSPSWGLSAKFRLNYRCDRKPGQYPQARFRSKLIAYIINVYPEGNEMFVSRKNGIKYRKRRFTYSSRSWLRTERQVFVIHTRSIIHLPLSLKLRLLPEERKRFDLFG